MSAVITGLLGSGLTVAGQRFWRHQRTLRLAKDVLRRMKDLQFFITEDKGKHLDNDRRDEIRSGVCNVEQPRRASQEMNLCLPLIVDLVENTPGVQAIKAELLLIQESATEIDKSIKLLYKDDHFDDAQFAGCRDRILDARARIVQIADQILNRELWRYPFGKKIV